MKSILIVEDDITYGMILKTWLGKKGFQVSSASSIARAQKHIEAETVDLILSDLRLPDRDGIDLLKWLGEHSLHIPLIIMTGYADIQSAVQAMKLGACDYIAKPVNPDELLKKMDEALKSSSVASEQTIRSTQTDHAFDPNRPSVSSKQTMRSESNGNPCRKGAENASSDYLEGESDAARQLYNYVNLVSPTNMSVLINGASGTGKEYVAQRIHKLSRRAKQPFIAIDFTVPDTVLKTAADTKPAASPIFCPASTRSPFATTGLAGAPICWDNGNTRSPFGKTAFMGLSLERSLPS